MALHTGTSERWEEADAGIDRPERLLAQRTLFTAPTPAAPDALYIAATQGVVERERHRLTVLPHAFVTTNTYFGRFPASYWQRWTSARAVDVSAVVGGSGLVRVMASDSKGRPRPVAARRLDGTSAEPVTLTVPIDRFVDGGALWLEVETGADTLTLERVRWSVEMPRPRRPTVVVICTYNRVEDCLATLGTLAADGEVAAGLSAVYVIDQGTDTLDSRDTFPALRESLGTTLHHVRQPNLGGAGGFTRGIFEALRDTAGPVNVLLMDDDIRLEPDTVVRLRALADRSDEPILVGGQMLNLLHPDRLHVGAETADLTNLRAGQPVEDAFTDVDVTEEQQDIRVDAGYNAWWTCLIPSEAVEAVGYPLPVFFQWDDIEFGLRAGAAGFPTVTLPGAGVWHADFAWKNWDDWSRYFSFRNALITSALHSGFDRRRVVEYLAKQLGSYLLSMRYGLAELLIRAVEDFLRGPDVLEDGGAQVAPAVRKLWADHPETRNHPPSAVPGIASSDVLKRPRGGTPSRPRAVMGKRIAWQLLGRQRPVAAISDADAAWWHVSLFETAVVTDPSQEGVRVRRFDRDRAGRLARQGGAVLWRLSREGGRAQQRYRDRLPELTSRANWSRLFGTD
jgi:galactofuranosylgalactofuranosylrhamnosyl-N-acetylglucosaminyl-diphospho-decaprenol beta-1,5/1,6-galactofuranosyltransferase